MTNEDPNQYLGPTTLLDYRASAIQALIAQRNWAALTPFDRIGAAYDFVRDEITFGYNRADDMAASDILADGYGQCNTKAVLLMALLRGLQIPCRLHGFTIHKGLQRGIVPELVYGLAPSNILHSWVEVFHEGVWVELEGFILDSEFLTSLQDHFKGQGDLLCGYGAGTDCLAAPDVRWRGASTYIQKSGISADLGLFDSPDAFYGQHRQSIGVFEGLLYRTIIRHWMNLRVRRIRAGHVPNIPGGPSKHEHPAGGALAKRETEPHIFGRQPVPK